jgi:dihydrofolate reductase
MGRISVFNFITLNGFFEGPEKGEMGWHKHGEEENDFAVEMLKSGNTLLFGRITYALMASYWPTPMAIENEPAVAEGMNKAEKIVFSTSLKKAEWNNTRLVKENIFEEVKKFKKIPGKDMAVLGSGSIITQFAEHGLIDEYQLLVDPVIIGDGRTIFKGLSRQLDLKLKHTRTLKSGVILLCYEPVK